MPILVDSSIFCAYANLNDVHHQKARKIMADIAEGKYRKPITSDYVFDESVAVALRKAGKEEAIILGSYMINSEVFLIKVDEIIFMKAWDFFQKSSKFSFTDCTLLAMAKVFGIENIATFDKEFKQVEWINVIDGG